MGGFWSNSIGYIIGIRRLSYWILVTLTIFSRSQETLEFQIWTKKAWVYPILWIDEWILMKLTWIHYWDEAIERLDFADLDPSFKVTGDIGISNSDQNACLHPATWTNEWIIIKLAWIRHWDKENKWVHFCDLELIFKVTGVIRMLNLD